jgi:g-D-glutamyl-meso-diaminopimelate peptidase
MDIYVRRGDSFWYFSNVFNIPLQLIIDSNSNLNPNALKAGQTVKVPGFAAVDYRIRAGDTLWGIAQSRNIKVDALLLANLNINPNGLFIGQMIKIPLRVTWRIVQGKKNYDYDALISDLRRLENVYPFMRVPSIGNSVLGKRIPETLIGNGDKRVHYNASFHANEWITTPVIMTFLNDYLLALTNKSSIRGLSMLNFYGKTTLSIVPMVNPDGVDLVLNGPPDSEPWNERVVELNKGSRDFTGWKANIRGVDLNDQFPAEWELEKARNPNQPGPRDYPGEQPLSEPEAIGMAEMTRRRDFSRVLAFHTQGEVIYWGFQNLEPPESETMVNEFARVSGYQPVKTIESYAGYKDWFIQDWRRPGFTVELGFGINPLPLSQFDEIYEEALGIFLAGLYL